jgi:archaellum component FlaC
MKGGFDLYGNYYPNADDALNAEMAQCNEIDNNINRKKIINQQREIDELRKKVEDLFNHQIPEI